jgi:hypothetical protein
MRSPNPERALEFTIHLALLSEDSPTTPDP